MNVRPAWETILDAVGMALHKLAYLLAIVAMGAFARRRGLIGDEGESTLGRLLIDLCWPALIFVQICRDLTVTDLRAHWTLPLLAMVTAFFGYGLTRLALRVRPLPEPKRRVYLYHGLMNNFVFLSLPFIAEMIPGGRGPALLFVQNLGFMALIWTFGVTVVGGALPWRERLWRLLSPGLVSTVLALLLVGTGGRAYVPELAMEILATVGGPTIFLAMLLTGSILGKLGREAFRFDAATGMLVGIRLLLVPGVLLGLTLLWMQWMPVSTETFIIFTMVNAMPTSLHVIGMALRFGADADYAARGVLWTHLLAILTVPVVVWVIRAFTP